MQKVIEKRKMKQRKIVHVTKLYIKVDIRMVELFNEWIGKQTHEYRYLVIQFPRQ